MTSLTTYHFLFTTQVQTPLVLDEHYGSALRGSFFQAIWRTFCTNKDAESCAACPLHTMCPVSALVAPLREENPRGQDIPRPYILLTALSELRRYEPGEVFGFGLTFFGSIIQLLPYLMLSLKELEAAGLGQRVQGQRGRFQVTQVESYHPWQGTREVVYQRGQPSVQVPALAVTREDVQARVAQLPDETITLTFLTPIRLVDRDRLVKRAEFRPLLHRLLDRFVALEAAYGQGASLTREEIWGLSERAEQVECVQDETRWDEYRSYSSRLGRATPISGLLGRATFHGDLAPFREWLVWGELIHVGKSCVKGNGWYKVEA